MVFVSSIDTGESDIKPKISEDMAILWSRLVLIIPPPFIPFGLPLIIKSSFFIATLTPLTSRKCFIPKSLLLSFTFNSERPLKIDVPSAIEAATANTG